MRLHTLLFWGLVNAAPASAGEKADFIEGTYAMEGRCEALAAIKAGAPKNVSTVPETLSADGFDGWEGGCTFGSIKVLEAGKRWSSEMACAEGADEWVETDEFLLDSTSGKITVTVEGKTSVFVRCDDGKGN
jgi:hypothetical protein